ncbi:MAG: hypothetical protein KC455_01655 [Carnobacterium sp.]|nr:hypothetical protein [Carnobacterium sp.]
MTYNLPFRLPFDNHTRSLYRYKGKDLAVIIHNHNSKQYIYRDMVIPDLRAEIEIVLFSYSYLSKEVEEEKMHYAINFTLEFLQHLIESLMVKYDSPGIHRISRQDLPPLIPVTSIRSSNFKESSIIRRGILNPHFHNIPKEQSKLTSKEVNEFIGFVNESNKSPFINSVLYVRQSKNFLESGNYAMSVIHVQTAVEIFMYTLYRLILKNREKISKDKIENKLQAGYKNILNEHLKKYFEEVDYTFNFDFNSNPYILLNGYKRDVYLLRNKVIHEGYTCSEEEANRAFILCEEILKNTVNAIHSTTLKENVFKDELFI